MLNRIIEYSLRNRLLVCLAALALVAIGARSISQLSIDAFPDTTPVQVQVNTVAASLNPIEIEQQITFPVELSIGGLPGLENVRSMSKFGFSQVVATFADSTDLYLARQLVSERLAAVELPEGIAAPQLGPISTGLGEVFHYVVKSDDPGRSLTELRELHDWVIKPELRKVPGVAEVNSWGGFEKQYHVVVEPDRLIKHGLTFEDLFAALQTNNRSVGGGQVTRGGESLLVHGMGLATTVEEIGGIVLASVDGAPVQVRDVAEVRMGHEIRRGAVSADGAGEVVLGLGFMLMGENSHEVTRALRERLEAVQGALPDDVAVEVAYDRTDLVDQVIRTVEHNLLAGALLVVAVLFAFLGNLRAGLIVAAAIPLSMLFAGSLMLQAGIAASLLSLGAIDFGLIVDGTVVMVENSVRHLAAEQRKRGRALTDQERQAALTRAPLEVARPVVFGVGIIASVFLPILTLEGVEGKMFRPMALTMIFALLGSLILALTVMPVLASLILSKQVREVEPWLVRLTRSLYRPVLEFALRFRRAAMIGAAAIIIVAAWVGTRIGGEFLPRLGEGAIAINVIRLAGVSIDESVRYNTRIEQLLLAEFPNEVARVWSRIGSAEVATDPMGIELTDLFATLKPRNQWTRARTQGELSARMNEVLGDLPGLNLAFTQPIEMRLNEMISGVRSDIAIKVFGDDFDELVRISDAVQHVLLTIPGAGDISGEQVTGQPVLRIDIKPEALGRYGIPADHVLNVVESAGGRRVGEIREGQRRFPLVVRLPDRSLTDPGELAATLIPTNAGAVVPLDRLAHVYETEGASTIQREWGRRRVTVQCNVRDRPVGSFVAEARDRVAAEVAMPDGYTIEWGGQFENMQRANARLMFVVPVTLGIVFVLLYFSLRSVRDVLVVATGIPFAAVGGVAALALRGMPFTVSAAIGFIALSGIAILNGLVLVTFIRQRIREGVAVPAAVRDACDVRLRPVLMTALVAAVGFVPMALNTGMGAEVQRPLATVVIGGIITATVLTLIVLPALCQSFFARGPRPDPTP